jgi:hypothetical protein
VRGCWTIFLALAACGDNRSPCDYRETADGTNGATAEDTGFVLGDGARSVCGTIEGGHYDTTLQTVDIDRYRVTSGESGELLVQLEVESGDESLAGVTVSVFDTSPHPVLLAEGSLRDDLADHSAFVAAAPPGPVDVVVTASAGSDVTGTLDYRLRLTGDPFASCGAAQMQASYVESIDGPDSTGNDLVSADFAAAPTFALIAGGPEPTGMTLAGTAYRVTGSATASVRVADAYLDRDTYALATGEYVNELALRVDWDPTAGADLDYMMFEANTLAPVVTATRASSDGVERQIFALHPRANYWLWVGRYASGTSTADVPYSVTLCGSHFY